MIIEKLQWDSDFLGLRVGRVMIASEEEISALIEQEDRVCDDYDLVYIFAKHGLNLPFSNARRVDEKVLYSLSDFSIKKASKNVIIWDNRKGVNEDLHHLALESGQYSRFRLDDRFPYGTYERLYSHWIEQSVNQVMASEVFCCMLDNVPKGMVTLAIKDTVATIGLVAVHEEFYRQGIGTAMMRHVINYADEHRCQMLFVATQQKNTSACRLYEKVGFRVDSVTDVWHWWL